MTRGAPDKASASSALSDRRARHSFEVVPGQLLGTASHGEPVKVRSVAAGKGRVNGHAEAQLKTSRCGTPERDPLR